MATDRVRRRLAAALALDVVGYSRLMGQNEAGTLAALIELRKTIIEPIVSSHSGRIVKLMGDGALVEFASAVDAVECGIAIQKSISAGNSELSDDKAIRVRIGINLGEVVGEGSDIFGDGVNIAARLESLAEPGGICISGKVQEEIRGKVDCALEDMGEQTLKNIDRPVRAFQVSTRAGEAGAGKP